MWFFTHFPPGSVALTILVLGIIAAVGLSLGSVRVFRINLGIGGVLFAGLFFGYVFNRWYETVRGQPGAHLLNHEILEFAKDFGLVLFVYTIGIQVGPGFLASLRKQGLKLNLMAAAIVLLGVAITLGLHRGLGVQINYAAGMFSGATTNTPSLAAAQEALRGKGLTGSGAVAGYAIAYPFGIVGIILTMVLIRSVFRIVVPKEGEALAKQEAAQSSIMAVNLEVRNANLDGLPVSKIPTIADSSIVISRVLQNKSLQVARPSTTLRLGDVLLAVGPREQLEQLRLIVGSEATVDLKSVPSPITSRRILVTKRPALGKTAAELNLTERFAVSITRIRRGEVEFTAPNVPLQFGDTVLVVGEDTGIRAAADELGDSLKMLNHPQVIPIFVGLILGVIVGAIPITFPGVPAPVKLGLAGGTLLVAIVLSRLGHFGPLVWYLPTSANFALREVGIVLFLACVGYTGSGLFVTTLFEGPLGLQLMAYAAIITAIPIIAVGLFARAVLKLNYMHICGLLAGSMTDPPALQFAGTMTSSDAPSVAYATVYPLVMLLRVLSAQAMVLLLA